MNYDVSEKEFNNYMKQLKEYDLPYDCEEEIYYLDKVEESTVPYQNYEDELYYYEHFKQYGFSDTDEDVSLVESFNHAGVPCDYKFLNYLDEAINLIDICYSYIKINKTKTYADTLIINDGKLERFSEKSYKLTHRTGLTHFVYFNTCPFHPNGQEYKSFMIDFRRNLYYCLGCAAGGGVFDFVMNIYNITIVETALVFASIIKDTVPTDKIDKNIQTILNRFPNTCQLPVNLIKIAIQLTRYTISPDIIHEARRKRKRHLKRLKRYLQDKNINSLFKVEEKQNIFNGEKQKRIIFDETKIEELVQKSYKRLSLDPKFIRTYVINLEKKYTKEKMKNF
jgi:DNA primase (bacterial type)